MTNNQTNKMSVWLFKRPAIFSLLSMAFLFLATVIGIGITSILNIGAAYSKIIAGTFVTIALFGATAITIRKLPGTNLDRRSFVALSTAQMFITSIVFIVTTIAVVANAQTLMLRMLWLESNSTALFLATMIILALFYMFLLGIYIGNLYAKYRRIRAMGVSMWRTLATAPFGFCMLWIPGYLIGDTQNRKSIVEIKSKWYARLVDWIMERPTRNAAALVILLLMSGFFLGFNAIVFTMVAAFVFVIWASIVGPDNLRKNIGGRYTNIAIAINIIAIIAVIGLFTVAGRNVPETYTYSPDPIMEITE
ncbi:hypothetical protein HDR61_01135 [bacterium]|nr:hypothetical protein [bacterium]